MITARNHNKKKRKKEEEQARRKRKNRNRKETREQIAGGGVDEEGALTAAGAQLVPEHGVAVHALSSLAQRERERERERENKKEGPTKKSARTKLFIYTRKKEKEKRGAGAASSLASCVGCGYVPSHVAFYACLHVGCSIWGSPFGARMPLDGGASLSLSLSLLSLLVSFFN